MTLTIRVSIIWTGFIGTGLIGIDHGRKLTYAMGGDEAGASSLPVSRSRTSPWPTRRTTWLRPACATSSDPRGTAARIHQHLDIGQTEVDWDAFFGTLGRSTFMLDAIAAARPAGPTDLTSING